MQRARVLLLSCLLAAPFLPAQEPAPTTAATPSSPLFARTSTLTYARMLSVMFDGDIAGLQRPPQGKHYQMQLDDGGRLVTQLQDGHVEGLELDTNPRALAQLFAQELQDARARAEGMAGVAGAMFGSKTDFGGFVGWLFDLPAQMQRLQIRSTGNPRDKDQGLHLSFDMQPVPDTKLARIVGAMRAHPGGAPQLPQQDAAMQLRLALDPTFVPVMTDMTMPFMEALGFSGAEWVAMAREMAGYQDGTAAVSFGMGSPMTMVIGLAQPQKMADLLASERYAELTQKSMADVPMFVDDPKFARTDHRDVPITSVTVEMDDRMAASNPMFGGQSVMTTHVAIAGGWLLQSMFGQGNAGIRGLVDAALNQKIERAPLRDNALLTVDMSIPDMVPQMAHMGGELPERFTLALARSGAGLSLKMVIQ